MAPVSHSADRPCGVTLRGALPSGEVTERWLRCRGRPFTQRDETARGAPPPAKKDDAGRPRRSVDLDDEAVHFHKEMRQMCEDGSDEKLLSAVLESEDMRDDDRCASQPVGR